MKSLALNCLLVVSAVCSAFGQNSDPVLMKINGKPISKSEFEYIYNKNNSNNSLEKKSLQEYAELFVNFKLKVEEAKSQGLDTTSSFKSEYLGYRAELSKPYLTDSKAEERFLREMYNRYLKDVEASHILVRFPSHPTPEDTLKAWNKINAIYKRLQKEDFVKVARSASEDESVSENDGSVGWIRVLKTSYAFETACYQTPVGQFSKPFRSDIGYHVVKITKQRESQGEVLVRQIMRSTYNKETSYNAASIIDSLYRIIKKGDDFKSLAKKYTQDNSNVANEGLMTWIKPGQVHPNFSKVAFELKSIGDVSEPFETSFGWHIIKLEDKRGPRPFAEIKDFLIEKCKQSERGLFGQRYFLDSLKRTYNFKYNQKELEEFYPIVINNSLNTPEFYNEGIKLNKQLFSIADKSFTQADFFQYIRNSSTEKKSSKEIIDEKFKAYVDNQLIIYEQSQLDKKYPEFKFLMQEYHDGILLFEVNNKEVWDKSSKDVEGLSNYFKANIDKYAWDKPRFKGRLIYCRDKETFKAAQQLATKFHGDVLERYLKGRLNDSIKYVKVEKGLFAMGESKMIDKVVFKLKVDYTPAPDDSFPYVLSDGVILKTHPEDYTDVKGKLSSDYQEYLEAEWIKTLKAKYPVEINQEVLKTVKKN
jgi:peptidyl-prolyl cis-trans isomerase SurA